MAAAADGMSKRRARDWLTPTGLLLFFAVPAAVLAVFTSWHGYQSWGNRQQLAPTAVLLLLAEVLAALMFVARWFQRTGTNSDIEELRKLAFTYRLGGTIALRPFATGKVDLGVASSLTDYDSGVDEPAFFKSAVNPPFLLALVLVLALGLFGLYAHRLGLVETANLILSGPEVTRTPLLARGWTGVAPGAATTLTTYQSGALLCVFYAFLGALLWSIVYVSRRMTTRDVTAHTYQTVSVRIITSAIVALFVYHLAGSAGNGGDLAARRDGDYLMVAAFAAGTMPEVVLRWLEGRARWLFSRDRYPDALDLEHLQGIDAYTRERLIEAGVNDAQALAAANPLRLALQTPFSLTQIMDWIGQAFLFVQLGKGELEVLRREQRIRTAWQLPLPAAADAAAGEETVPPPAGPPGPADDLLTTARLLGSDPCFVRARQVAERMRLVDGRSPP